MPRAERNRPEHVISCDQIELYNSVCMDLKAQDFLKTRHTNYNLIKIILRVGNAERQRPLRCALRAALLWGPVCGRVRYHHNRISRRTRP